MKDKKLKTLLLPIGLLCLTGTFFVEHLMKVNVPDLMDGLVKGVGIGLIILALIGGRIQRAKLFHN